MASNLVVVQSQEQASACEGLFDLENMNGFGPNAVLSAFDCRVFQLILLPTERCNFRCSYCYENFSRGSMKREVLSAIVQLIRNRLDDIELLRLSWFGGEPLLAWKAVSACIDEIKGMCDARSVRLVGSFTTNGFHLDSHKIEWLSDRDHGRFQVTLDGWESDHDQTRTLANGGPTFGTIWRNLLSARDLECDFQVIVRMHLSPHNMERIRALVSNFKKNFGDDSRFGVHLHKITNLGGPNAGRFPVLSTVEYRNRLEEVKAELHGISGYVDSEVDKYEERSICYAARPNCLVIRSDGVVCKCTVALDDPRNRVGILNLDGTLGIDPSKFRAWLRGFDSFSVPALSCPYSNITMTLGDT